MLEATVGSTIYTDLKTTLRPHWHSAELFAIFFARTHTHTNTERYRRFDTHTNITKATAHQSKWKYDYRLFSLYLFIARSVVSVLYAWIWRVCVCVYEFVSVLLLFCFSFQLSIVVLLTAIFARVPPSLSINCFNQPDCYIYTKNKFHQLCLHWTEIDWCLVVVETSFSLKVNRSFRATEAEKEKQSQR